MDADYTAPDSANSALLTIDVQNDFTLPGAPAEIEGTYDALPKMRELVQLYRDAGAPIVHVVRLYRRDGSNVDMCRREAIENGETVVAPETEGAEIVDGLKPANTSLDAETLLSGELQKLGQSEWAMYKPRWGAFYDTPLDNHLSKLSVNTVVVCGCNFPNCPRTTIYEASERDYRTVFVTDATSRTYERGVGELEDIGVNTMTTSGVLDWYS